MSQRLPNTKWLWCLLALSAGPAWSPADSVAVKAPPNTPATVEAQAKFFQYRHLPTHEDFTQGHRAGSERHFTERHERAKPSEGIFNAKVRWGDKHGGYGEHYWDLNHAGHAHNHGNDDYSNDGDNGAYRVHDDESNDPYDEPSAQSPSFGDDYDPERAASYEENNRAKRAQPRLKAEKKDDAKESKLRIRVEEESEEDDDEEEEEVTTTPAPRLRKKQKRHKPREQNYEEEQQDTKPTTETNQYESRRQSEPTQYTPYEQESKAAAKANQFESRRQPEQTQYTYNQQEQKPAAKTQNEPRRQLDQAQYATYDQQVQQQPKPQNPYASFDQQPQQPAAKVNQFESTRQPQQTHYVPYEAGAGVRQYHPPEVVPAASAPRLFLEPSTGHVVDRATGQAYVLQPIVANFN